MKKVCIVSSSIISSQSGAGKRAHRIAEYLHDRNMLSAIITTGLTKSDKKDVRIPGTKIYNLNGEYEDENRKNKSFVWYFPRVVICLVKLQLSILWIIYNNKNDISVLHVFETSEWMSLMTLLCGKLLGTSSLAEVALLGKDDPESLMYDDPSKLRGAVKSRLFYLAQKYVSRSDAIKKKLLDQGIEKEKIYETYNPIDVDKYSPIDRKEKVKMKKKNGLENRVVVIYAGRIWKRKGTILLLKAFSMLDERNKARLLIAGEPLQNRKGQAYYEKVKKVYFDRNLEESVYFLGYKKDLVKFLLMSDVFALPSSREGLSNAMLEAMSCGLPIIAKNDDSVHGGLLKDGEHGRLVETRNAEKFSSALNEIIKNKKMRNKMSSNCRYFAKTNFKMSTVMRGYLNLYSSM